VNRPAFVERLTLELSRRLGLERFAVGMTAAAIADFVEDALEAALGQETELERRARDRRAWERVCRALERRARVLTYAERELAAELIEIAEHYRKTRVVCEPSAQGETAGAAARL
jgi:hypothetical protein